MFAAQREFYVIKIVKIIKNVGFRTQNQLMNQLLVIFLSKNRPMGMAVAYLPKPLLRKSPLEAQFDITYMHGYLITCQLNKRISSFSIEINIVFHELYNSPFDSLFFWGGGWRGDFFFRKVTYFISFSSFYFFFYNNVSQK